MGLNSSCHYHLQQHYDVYRERCEAVGIPEHHWAVPHANLTENGARVQKKVDSMFVKATLPTEFTPEGFREALAKFVVCDDQVSVEI